MKKTVLLLSAGMLLLGVSCARKACPAYGSSQKAKQFNTPVIKVQESKA